MPDAQRKTQYSSAWIMLLALLTSLGPLSIDMYLPALPQMAQDFGVSTQRIANTLPAYFLGLAAGQLIYGRSVTGLAARRRCILACACTLQPA